MIRPQDIEKPASNEALFRFLVVSDVLTQVLRGEVRADAVAAVAAETHFGVDGAPRHVSDRSIYRWLAEWEAGQFAGLEPASRRRTTTSVVLPERLLAFVAVQKTEDISASLPEILLRARALGVIGDEPIDRTTLYRACVRMSVPVVRCKKAKVRDSRRYAYPHRMQMVLSDGKHFRAGATRAKRLAMFFIDDASRYGLDVVVAPTETRALFLRGLYGAIQRHGRMGIMYLDHGSGFIAKDTVTVVSQLPAMLIHGEVRYPEGHGKVEKFHQTADDALLLRLDGRADVDPHCGALELRLRHWLFETYNHTPHESLPHKQTPWQRFSTDTAPLNFPESLVDLRNRFVVHLRRRVSNDHVVSIKSVDYEVPRGLAGRHIIVYRQVLDDVLSVLHDGRFVRIAPVDLTANAYARRGKATASDDVVTPQKSAADLAFERDFRPIVGPDGGFSDQKPDSTHKERLP